MCCWHFRAVVRSLGVIFETLYIKFQNVKDMFIKSVYFTSTVIQLKNYILKDPSTYFEELELEELLQYDLTWLSFCLSFLRQDLYWLASNSHPFCCSS